MVQRQKTERQVVGVGEEGMRSCVVGTEFSVFQDRKSPIMDGCVGGTVTKTHLPPQNCKLNNSEVGKLYVMHILPSFQKQFVSEINQMSRKCLMGN